MTYQYPDDRPTSMRSRFATLSLSARLAIVLAAIYVVQLSVFLIGKQDALGELLQLRLSPIDWQTIYRVASYGLAHSVGDPLHVTYNAVGLFFFGTVLESERGPRTMMFTFWAGVVAGGIAPVGLDFLP